MSTYVHFDLIAKELGVAVHLGVPVCLGIHLVWVECQEFCSEVPFVGVLLVSRALCPSSLEPTDSRWRSDLEIFAKS